MKIELLTEITIAAKPEQIWQVLTDFPNYSAWNSFIINITGKLAAGKKLTVEIVSPGLKKQTFKPTLIKVIPQQEMRWVGNFIFNWLFRGEHYFKLEPIGSNNTKLIHGEIFSGILVRLFKRTLQGATLEGFQNMNKSLAKQIKI